jgi:hypothetical protein
MEETLAVAARNWSYILSDGVPAGLALHLWDLLLLGLIDRLRLLWLELDWVAVRMIPTFPPCLVVISSDHAAF